MAIITQSRFRPPNYGFGFARSAAESANPGLWKGLIGAWYSSFGVTGDTLRDATQQRHNMTATGTTSWATGRYGPAVDYDGSTGFFATADVDIIDGGDEITLAAWCKNDTASGTDGIVSNKVSWVGNGMGIYADGSIFKSRIGAGNIIQSATVTRTDWHFVASTYDGTLRLYVDGKMEDSETTSQTASTSVGACLGRFYPNASGYHWDGLIGNALAYKRALSHSEILQLYADPFAPFRLRDRIISISSAGGTTVNCTLGTVAVNGLQAEVEQGTTISCTLGTVTVTGLQAEIEQGTTVACTLGTIAVTGLQATVSNEPSIDCTLGTVAVTGLQAEVEQGTTVDCTLGTVAATGLQAEIEQGTTVDCTLGTIAVSGLQAEVEQGTTVTCGIGALVVQALAASLVTPVECSLATITVASLAATIQGGVSTKLNVAVTTSSPGGLSVAVSSPGGLDITIS